MPPFETVGHKLEKLKNPAKREFYFAIYTRTNSHQLKLKEGRFYVAVLDSSGGDLGITGGGGKEISFPHLPKATHAVSCTLWVSGSLIPLPWQMLPNASCLLSTNPH